MEMEKPSNCRALSQEEIEYDGGISEEGKGALIGLACGAAAFALLGGVFGMAVYRETLSLSAALKTFTGFTVVGAGIGAGMGYLMEYDRIHNPEEW